MFRTLPNISSSQAYSSQIVPQVSRAQQDIFEDYFVRNLWLNINVLTSNSPSVIYLAARTNLSAVLVLQWIRYNVPFLRNPSNGNLTNVAANATNRM